MISQSRDRSPAGHAEAARSSSIPALLSGQVQIGHLGGSETLSAAVAGGDLVIISITGPVYPYPVVAPALFGDAVEQLAATNDEIKSFDLNSILDTRSSRARWTATSAPRSPHAEELGVIRDGVVR